MKINLLPAEESSGSLASTGGPDVTSLVSMLDVLNAQKARVLRQGRNSLLIDIEPAALSNVLRAVRGWTAEPVSTTSNKSAFEGVVEYSSAKKAVP